MQIAYFDKLDSTQLYLKNNLPTLSLPILIYTNEQTNGIGSRENEWLGEKGNLFFSFAVHKSYFSEDIPLHSLSIYIGFHIKSILSTLGSQAFLKWPNDLYIKDKKIGGIITHIKKDNIIIGCGINSKSSKNFQALDVSLDDNSFLQSLIDRLNQKDSWEKIFSLYKEDFYKNYDFSINHNDNKLSLKDSILQNDGSIEIDGEIIFNSR